MKFVKAVLIIAFVISSFQSKATVYILISNSSEDISLPVPDNVDASFTTVVPSLISAQSYIRLHHYVGNQVTGHITDNIIIYVKGGLYKDHNVEWYATGRGYQGKRGHQLKIIAYNNEEVIFDGSKDNGSFQDKFFRLTPKYDSTNLWLEGLTIRRYFNGISLGKSDFDTVNCVRKNDVQNENNTIINNVFIEIGNKILDSTNPDNIPNSTINSFAAVSLSNSINNKILSNVFYKIEEKQSQIGHLHALYISNGSSGNIIKDNYIGLNTGDPIRLRNGCNNIIIDNIRAKYTNHTFT